MAMRDASLLQAKGARGSKSHGGKSSASIACACEEIRACKEITLVTERMGLWPCEPARWWLTVVAVCTAHGSRR